MMNCKKITLLIAFIFLINNCAEKPLDEESASERFSVLKYSSEISETLTLDVSEIKLGEPREIYYWSKDFQNPQNNLGHISTSINFERKEKIISGKSGPLNLTQPVFFEENMCHLINNGFIECLNTKTKQSYFKVDIKDEETNS